MDVILEPTLKGRALGPDERVPSSADRQIPLTLTGRMPWLEKGEHIKAATPTTSSRGAWMVNNISWVDPSAPLYLTKGECCVVDEPKKNYGTHVIDIKLGEVVDLVVVVPRQNGEWPFTHPLHLHGYKFWVVATGKLPFVNRSADTYNLVDPVRADT
jgi:FtsP/CotA-like multicopper oxidase with cupredoxin domain